MTLRQAYSKLRKVDKQVGCSPVTSAFDHQAWMWRLRYVEGCLHELSHAALLKLFFAKEEQPPQMDKPKLLHKLITVSICQLPEADRDIHECKTIAVEIRAAQILGLNTIMRRRSNIFKLAARSMTQERYQIAAHTEGAVSGFTGQVDQWATQVARIVNQGDFYAGTE